MPDHAVRSLRFANIGSLGILIGGLSVLVRAKERVSKHRAEISYLRHLGQFDYRCHCRFGVSGLDLFRAFPLVGAETLNTPTERLYIG